MRTIGAGSCYKLGYVLGATVPGMGIALTGVKVGMNFTNNSANPVNVYAGNDPATIVDNSNPTLQIQPGQPFGTIAYILNTSGHTYIGFQSQAIEATESPFTSWADTIDQLPGVDLISNALGNYGYLGWVDWNDLQSAIQLTDISEQQTILDAQKATNPSVASDLSQITAEAAAMIKNTLGALIPTPVWWILGGLAVMAGVAVIKELT